MEKDLKAQMLKKAVGPAMSLVEGFTKDVKPENPVSQWIDGHLYILFELPGDDSYKLLTKLMVMEANHQPEVVLNKLLRFYDEFRKWYREYQKLEVKDGEM